MKDMMIEWVENHKGERPDGTWFVLDCDWLGEREFPTEEALDTFLWNYLAENPECYLPSVP